MSTQSLYYQLFYSNPKKFKETIEIRKLNTNNIINQNLNKLNSEVSIKEINKFYNNNNYVYFNLNNPYTSFKCTEPDLPEWYNTERDQDVVDDIDYQFVFYDSTISIETEDNLEEEYQEDINKEDDYESSGDEWTSI
jgi:hypothetical protein